MADKRSALQPGGKMGRLSLLEAETLRIQGDKFHSVIETLRTLGNGCGEGLGLNLEAMAGTTNDAILTK